MLENWGDAEIIVFGVAIPIGVICTVIIAVLKIVFTIKKNTGVSYRIAKTEDYLVRMTYLSVAIQNTTDADAKAEIYEKATELMTAYSNMAAVGDRIADKKVISETQRTVETGAEKAAAEQTELNEKLTAFGERLSTLAADIAAKTE